MKSQVIPFFLVLLFALSPAGRAQDSDASGGTVKVTITTHSDKTYTAMKTDSDAHTAESALYTSDNKLLQTTVFDLDAQGRATGGTVYAPGKDGDPKGVAQFKVQYKYDSANRISEVDNYTTADQLMTRVYYHYDNTGKLAKVDTYDPAGKLVSSANAPTGPGKK